MARLEYEITGNITGLASAADGVKGILNGLQSQANKLKIDFFGAESEKDIKNIGNALTVVTSKINSYTTEAIKGSQAFKDQTVQKSLDTLSTKISVLNSNAQLFGNTIKNQKGQLNAYQQALNSLLGAGVNPLDSQITSLTTNINKLQTGSNKGTFFGGLGSAYGLVRQLAYILPGVGIAGIFNVALGPLFEFIKGLDILNAKLTQSEEILKTYNEVQKEGNKNAAAQITSLQLLYKAATDTTRSLDSRIEAAKELKDADFAAFGAASNLAIINGQLKNNLDAATDSILKQAQAQAALAKIQALSGSILDDEFQKNKIRTAEQAELSRIKGPSTTTTVIGAGSSATVATETLSVKQQTDIIHDQAVKAVKAIDEGENVKKRTIQFLTSFAEGITASSTTLKNANDILGSNFEGFNKRLSIAIKEGDLTQLTALENALKTKLESLAPTDPQIKNLRDKIQQVEDIIKNAYTVKPTKATPASGLSQEQFIEQIGNLSRSSGASANQSGLVGIDLELQQIKDKYISYYATLQTLDDKRDASAKISDKDRAQDEAKSVALDIQLRLDEAKEISDALIKNEQRTAQEVQRIRDEFGVKATQTRAREIAAVNTLADSEIIKAQGNADKLNAIDEGRTAAAQAINEKYTLIISQTYDKINDIVAQGNVNQTDTEAKKIAKIGLQYDKLTQQVNKYYTDLKTLQAQGDAALKGRDLNAEQQNSDNQLNKARQLQISIVLSATFSKALQSSIDTFGENFYSTIVGLGKARQDIDNKYINDLQNATDQASKDQINKIHELELATTTSFTSIFGDLISKFNQTFSQSLVQSFVKKITDGFGETLIKPALTDLGKTDPAISLANAGVSFSQTVIAAGEAFAIAAKGGIPPLTNSLTEAGNTTEIAVTKGGTSAQNSLSKGAANIAAAATVIGSVVSGLGKPTNSVTSGLGGALSGAGEGALLGSAIAPGVGTAIGAVAGGLIGLVGGLFSASKARKQVEEQQLEQQKQQTELLRQQVAYTSSVIGRMTANGVISNISVGALGQLVATVSGSDLQFVLDRNAKSR